MITCTLCLEEKEDEDFNVSSAKKNGKNSYCKPCQSKKNKLWMEANKIHRQGYDRDYKQVNQERVKENKHLWDVENQGWRKAYRKYHKSRYAAHAMKRYVIVKLSQPSWLSEVQLQEIETLYWLAADLKAVSGETYHVDHIIPLQGKNVCGLHVPWNLQILPADVNIQKSNTCEEALYE